MGTSDIAIHDLQTAVEHGVRDICEATAKVAKTMSVSEEAVMDAVQACARPATYARDIPVPGGYVATRTFTMHLVKEQAISVGVGDEILVRNGVVKIRDHQHGNVKVTATGNVALMTYRSDQEHLW